MYVSGFFDDCRLEHCPKIRSMETPVAFICDKCGELRDAGYEMPDKKRICTPCVDALTVLDALVLAGCLVIWE